MRYISTRGGGTSQNFKQVLMSGLAPDGGLYVPEHWPQIDTNEIKNLPYAEAAARIMWPFVDGFIPRQDFERLVHETYGPDIFRHPDVVPVKPLYDNFSVLELFHGPTIAFKDVALQLLGRLFDYALKLENRRITIVGATSGDTGSAAIEGCRHSPHARIFILYPHRRVSDVQRRQMTAINAPNVHTIAVEGNFDDCQNMVKSMFADEAFRTAMNLSAVNSINWARIMAQIVYYFTAANNPAFSGRRVSFSVPTGNFGNVFAAHTARHMGAPIDRLLIASNRNDILTRFFETGAMTARDVEPSLSPSMDIQISSNFERYLFEVVGKNPKTLADLMDEFKSQGRYNLTPTIMEHVKKHFTARRANDAETTDTIRAVYSKCDYILDPHTAVGFKAAVDCAADIYGPIVSLACAHPAKFPDAVEDAIGLRPALPDHLADLMERRERTTILPNDLKTVQEFIRSQP